MSETEIQALNIFDQTQISSVMEFHKYFPRVAFEVICDEISNIAFMDVITFQIKITRENLQENEEQGFVHSQTFPYLKKESFTIMLVDGQTEREIYAMTSTDNQSREHTVKMQYQPQQIGIRCFYIYVASDSYATEPFKQLITIDVKQRNESSIVEREQKYHEDDLNTGPSKFE